MLPACPLCTRDMLRTRSRKVYKQHPVRCRQKRMALNGHRNCSGQRGLQWTMLQHRNWQLLWQVDACPCRAKAVLKMRDTTNEHVACCAESTKRGEDELDGLSHIPAHDRKGSSFVQAPLTDDEAHPGHTRRHRGAILSGGCFLLSQPASSCCGDALAGLAFTGQSGQF